MMRKARLRWPKLTPLLAQFDLTLNSKQSLMEISDNAQTGFPLLQPAAPFETAGQANFRTARLKLPLVLTAVLGLVSAVRALYAFLHAVNGDELQHLHVVWE
jgi:hypothetical protein